MLQQDVNKLHVLIYQIEIYNPPRYIHCFAIQMSDRHIISSHANFHVYYMRFCFVRCVFLRCRSNMCTVGQRCVTSRHRRRRRSRSGFSSSDHGLRRAPQPRGLVGAARRLRRRCLVAVREVLPRRARQPRVRRHIARRRRRLQRTMLYSLSLLRLTTTRIDLLT